MPDQIEGLRQQIKTSESTIAKIQSDTTIAWQLGLNTDNQHKELIAYCQSLIERMGASE